MRCLNTKGKYGEVRHTEIKWSLISKSVTIIIFVEFIDQLINYPINCDSLSLQTRMSFTLVIWGKFSRQQFGNTFFLFFPENRIWHFMQKVSLECLHETSNPFFIVPWDTICMKCQILFSGKTWGKQKMSTAEIFTQHAVLMKHIRLVQKQFICWPSARNLQDGFKLKLIWLSKLEPVTKRCILIYQLTHDRSNTRKMYQLYKHKTFWKLLFNPCPAEPGCILPLQTVQIQISWLLKKPTDLDLHCLPLSMLI